MVSFKDMNEEPEEGSFFIIMNLAEMKMETRWRPEEGGEDEEEEEKGGGRRGEAAVEAQLVVVTVVVSSSRDSTKV